MQQQKKNPQMIKRPFPYVIFKKNQNILLFFSCLYSLGFTPQDRQVFLKHLQKMQAVHPQEIFFSLGGQVPEGQWINFDFLLDFISQSGQLPIPLKSQITSLNQQYSEICKTASQLPESFLELIRALQSHPMVSYFKLQEPLILFYEGLLKSPPQTKLEHARDCRFFESISAQLRLKHFFYSFINLTEWFLNRSQFEVATFLLKELTRQISLEQGSSQTALRKKNLQELEFLLLISKNFSNLQGVEGQILDFLKIYEGTSLPSRWIDFFLYAQIFLNQPFCPWDKMKLLLPLVQSKDSPLSLKNLEKKFNTENKLANVLIKKARSESHDKLFQLLKEQWVTFFSSGYVSFFTGDTLFEFLRDDFITKQSMKPLESLENLFQDLALFLSPFLETKQSLFSTLSKIDSLEKAAFIELTRQNKEVPPSSLRESFVRLDAKSFDSHLGFSSEKEEAFPAFFTDWFSNRVTFFPAQIPKEVFLLFQISFFKTWTPEWRSFFKAISYDHSTLFEAKEKAFLIYESLFLKSLEKRDPLPFEKILLEKIQHFLETSKNKSFEYLQFYLERLKVIYKKGFEKNPFRYGIFKSHLLKLETNPDFEGAQSHSIEFLYEILKERPPAIERVKFLFEREFFKKDLSLGQDLQDIVFLKTILEMNAHLFQTEPFLKHLYVSILREKNEEILKNPLFMKAFYSFFKSKAYFFENLSCFFPFIRSIENWQFFFSYLAKTKVSLIQEKEIAIQLRDFINPQGVPEKGLSQFMKPWYQSLGVTAFGKALLDILMGVFWFEKDRELALFWWKKVHSETSSELAFDLLMKHDFSFFTSEVELNSEFAKREDLQFNFNLDHLNLETFKDPLAEDSFDLPSRHWSYFYRPIETHGGGESPFSSEEKQWIQLEWETSFEKREQDLARDLSLLPDPESAAGERRHFAELAEEATKAKTVLENHRGQVLHSPLRLESMQGDPFLEASFGSLSEEDWSVFLRELESTLFQKASLQPSFREDLRNLFRSLTAFSQYQNASSSNRIRWRVRRLFSTLGEDLIGSSFIFQFYDALHDRCMDGARHGLSHLEKIFLPEAEFSKQQNPMASFISAVFLNYRRSFLKKHQSLNPFLHRLSATLQLEGIPTATVPFLEQEYSTSGLLLLEQRMRYALGLPDSLEQIVYPELRRLEDPFLKTENLLSLFLSGGKVQDFTSKTIVIKPYTLRAMIDELQAARELSFTNAQNKWLTPQTESPRMPHSLLTDFALKEPFLKPFYESFWAEEESKEDNPFFRPAFPGLEEQNIRLTDSFWVFALEKFGYLNHN